MWKHEVLDEDPREKSKMKCLEANTKKTSFLNFNLIIERLGLERPFKIKVQSDTGKEVDRDKCPLDIDKSSSYKKEYAIPGYMGGQKRISFWKRKGNASTLPIKVLSVLSSIPSNFTNYFIPTHLVGNGHVCRCSLGLAHSSH